MKTKKFISFISQVLKSFFDNECVCQGTEISSSNQAIDDLTLLCKEVAADGVSIIAVEKSTDRVVGVSFNKLQVLVSQKCNLKYAMYNFTTTFFHLHIETRGDTFFYRIHGEQVQKCERKSINAAYD